jgi:replicative DNA helicase
MMLYREDVYNEDCERPGVADVYIRKHRSGTTGRVSLFFDAERMAYFPHISVSFSTNFRGSAGWV